MTYNGWTNYHTWNVALYIANEYPLYIAAREYAQEKTEATYRGYLDRHMSPEFGDITPDGVSWTDPALDHDELDAFIRELAE